MSATDLTWIMRHEVASNASTDSGTTTWGLGVDGAGLFHVHRAEPHQGAVVTMHATLTDALVELPHALASYLEEHGQGMVLWSSDVAAGCPDRWRIGTDPT
jgi:hypothetical protein